MFYKSLHFICMGLLAFVSVGFGAKPYLPIINVDLQDEQPGDTIIRFNDITESKYYINVSNINSNVSFIVIQAHTYVENITLSYTNPLETNQYVNGTNIGLVWSRLMVKKDFEGDSASFYLVRHKPIFDKIKILLAVSTYDKDDPIPGGCNLEFETMIAPYQKISYDDDIITVINQPPSKNELFCNKANITTDVYYMYLKEYDNDTEEYFGGIKKMITVETILEYGTKVPKGLGYSKYKHIYNLYRGTGRVFAVVSTLGGKSSAYVPAVSFGCNLGNWSEDCVGPVGVHWKLMCAFLVILGSFICYGGHRCFKAGLFTIGFTFGSIITLLSMSIDDYYTSEMKAIYYITAGIVCGFLWVLLWWYFGAPLVSVQLTILLAGTLLASTFLYNELGDLIFFTQDLYFWLVFSTIVVLAMVPIFFYPSLYHIIALSLLGSYSFVVAMNYYIGGNLPYILINTYRRIAIKDFGLAVVDPPFQMLDLCQTILWALLFGVGIFVQYKESIGKAPFPPHRSGAHVRPQNDYRNAEVYPEPVASPNNIREGDIIHERTPLLLADTREYPPPYQH